MKSSLSPTLVVAAVIVWQQKILIVRRGPQETGAGEWEFPGGKVEKGETPEEALRREIQEELSLDVEVQECLGSKIYAYPQKTICLRVYWVRAPHDQLRLVDHDAFEWVEPQTLQAQKLSLPDQPFVEKIRTDYPRFIF